MDGPKLLIITVSIELYFCAHDLALLDKVGPPVRALQGDFFDLVIVN